MNFDEYQKKSSKTLIQNQSPEIILARMALGLSGESGEVAEKIKKVLRDNNGILSEDIKQDIAKELGDVLWYLARLADLSEVKLSEVAQGNLDKLYSRMERGKLGGSGDNR